MTKSKSSQGQICPIVHGVNLENVLFYDIIGIHLLCHHLNVHRPQIVEHSLKLQIN